MRRFYALLIALVLVGVAAFLFLRAKPPVSVPPSGGNVADGSPTATTTGVRTEGVATADKPKPSEAPNETGGDEKAKAEKKNEVSKKPSDPRFGTVEPVKGNANAQTAGVLEALKTRTHPENLSIMHPPETPFDKAAFEKNPQAYLDVVQPGRIFQTKQPGQDVTALKVLGDGYYRVKQGDAVKLTTQGEPLSPITFTSTDLGAFAENKLNSITVRADEKGVATVTFVATPGTLNDVNILAGSPLSSGQARFKVDVEQAQAHPVSTKK